MRTRCCTRARARGTRVCGRRRQLNRTRVCSIPKRLTRGGSYVQATASRSSCTDAMPSYDNSSSWNHPRPVVGRMVSPPSYLHMWPGFSTCTPPTSSQQSARCASSLSTADLRLALQQQSDRPTVRTSSEAFCPAACTHASLLAQSHNLCHVSTSAFYFFPHRRWASLHRPPNTRQCCLYPTSLGGGLEHGGRVSKYPRGGGLGAGMDRAWVRGAGGDVRPSYFNQAVLPPPSSAAAVRLRAATDTSILTAIGISGPRKFVGPSAGGGR